MTQNHLTTKSDCKTITLEFLELAEEIEAVIRNRKKRAAKEPQEKKTDKQN